MPVNSFENYPMAWKPRKEDIRPPFYVSIANMLERDIMNGTVDQTARLPPQRELADYLDLNVSTITHAYRLLEVRGIIHAVTGKGTFVSPNARALTSIVDQSSHPPIELGTIHPFYVHNRLIRDITAEILKSPSSEALFAYGTPLGSSSQRRAAVNWLQSTGVDATLDNTLIALGVQNALAVVLTSLFSPGDRIAVDSYTYANFIGLAQALNIQLISVGGDGEGMLPSSLEKACKQHGIRGAYLMPSGNNPTNVVMSRKRRKEIAEVLQKNTILTMEDDTYRVLSGESGPCVHALAPENCIYISGLSKPVCAGLRVAYICAPAMYCERLRRGLYNINLALPSLNIEVAAQVIRAGLHHVIVREKRELARKRNQLFYTLFPSGKEYIDTYSQWLVLPDGYTGRLFEQEMARQGVGVFGAERFCVGDAVECRGIRVATCSPPTDEALLAGLTIIKNTIENNRPGL